MTHLDKLMALIRLEAEYEECEALLWEIESHIIAKCLVEVQASKDIREVRHRLKDLYLKIK